MRWFWEYKKTISRTINAYQVSISSFICITLPIKKRLLLLSFFYWQFRYMGVHFWDERHPGIKKRACGVEKISTGSLYAWYKWCCFHSCYSWEWCLCRKRLNRFSNYELPMLYWNFSAYNWDSYRFAYSIKILHRSTGTHYIQNLHPSFRLYSCTHQL